MSRLNDIVSFIEYDFARNMIIEPEKRVPRLRESLLDVIKTYNPGVIVKAGLGNGQILYDLAKNSSAYIVVVEPSLAIMREFIKRHEGDAAVDRIHFINGEFNCFPVDYYAADMIVCIDYLDFLESGKVVDEFTRALQFDGILFMGSVVLEDDDLEGRYDDFMRSVFPLHNDYYLREDLKTFMDLNDLKFVKGTFDRYDIDLASLADYFAAFRADAGENPMAQIEEHRDEYAELYKLVGNSLSEPYYISVFTRVKPDKK